MANQRISFRAAIRSLAEEMSRDLDGHPEPEELLAYHEGQISEQEANLLREHLSLCTECCSLHLSLEAFPEPGQERGALETAELETAWRQLQERIRSRGEAFSLPSTELKVRPAAQRWSWALAASLLLMFGFSLGVAFDHHLREKAEATAKVLFFDLVPEGETTRGAESAGMESVRVPTGSRRLVLLLHLLEADTFSSYKVVLMNGPRAGWSDAGLKPDQDGIFAVDLPRKWLPQTGPFRIGLYGQEDGQDKLVATYRTQIE